MAIRISRSDPRYAMLQRSRNLRWNGNEAEGAAEIELCETAEQAAEALQRLVNAGIRPTIRSGGHCYEDFVVNNPGGSILDLSLLKSDASPGDGSRYRISPGQELGEVYLGLYKRHGVTIPAGSCYEVGAGGHITGGGYGVLSRLHGLTIDWVSAVEILTVDSKGHVSLRQVDQQHDPDLFRACRGAGGGNFGVVTGFLFDRLPAAPFEIVNAHLSFDWATMTEDNFTGYLAGVRRLLRAPRLRTGHLGNVCRAGTYARLLESNWPLPAILQPGRALRRPETGRRVSRSVFWIWTPGEARSHAGGPAFSTAQPGLSRADGTIQHGSDAVA